MLNLNQNTLHRGGLRGTVLKTSCQLQYLKEKLFTFEEISQSLKTQGWETRCCCQISLEAESDTF